MIEIILYLEREIGVIKALVQLATSNVNFELRVPGRRKRLCIDTSAAAQPKSYFNQNLELPQLKFSKYLQNLVLWTL